MAYPGDFPLPSDTGGPGAGAPIGGFGGNPAADRAAHRNAVVTIGKAPVLLVHGNGGAADVRPWDLLDQRRFLLAAGYSAELIWAPSYLGAGSVDLQTPHTNNVDDARNYLEAVCEYLAVDVVDVIAHSLGCTLMYAVFRGLDRQTAPVSWTQPKKWNRVGTFVALSGAFHGLGAGSIGEWRTGGEFMTELLAETAGGGGETPYGDGDPQTPGPSPHAISYFCATAAGDFVDAQNPGTGRLEGAVNRSYNLGSGTQGHQAVKESLAVFDDFRPLLNSVPPTPAAVLTLSSATGQYPAPLTVTVGVDPADLEISVLAHRLTRQFVNGAIVDTVVQTLTRTLRDGDSITLDVPGLWHLTASIPGAIVDASYWVGVQQVVAAITTDNSVPFDDSVLVTATASEPVAALYYSLDGTNWTPGAAVILTQDAVVSFLAITPEGIASDVVSRTFTKRVTWDDAVTDSAVNHFIARRIGVTEYLAYSDEFGFFTPFTLYLVDSRWVLDPQQPAVAPGAAAAVQGSTPADGAATDGGAEPADGTSLFRFVTVAAADPPPGVYPEGPMVITLEAVGDGPVNFTQDGSIPGDESDSFTGSARFELVPTGNHAISCRTVDAAGVRRYQVFHYAIGTV
jgi:hypothetical protein